MTDLSLDPKNWNEFRKLSHETLDLMIDYIQEKPEGKVWQPIPGDVKKALQKPIPQQSQSQADIINEFKELVLPYPIGNIHPRFWGWVIGSGTPFQIISAILEAGLNSPGGSFEQTTTYVEIQVIEWMKELFNFPESAFGILVSGGSMANYVGLAVARQAKVKNIRENGMPHNKEFCTLYTSKELHFSLIKAVEGLGFGRKALRLIATYDDLSIDIEALEKEIIKDKANGFTPICVIGTAGTVNTGAIDDLDRIAELCKRENLWFHVDGAFGALLVLSSKHKNRLTGIEKADSVAFDFHKWMHINYEAAFALIRNHDLHASTFAQHAHYTNPLTRGVASSEKMFSDYGPELSREFKALKIWMSIKEHGIQKLGQLIDQNIEQAQHLGSLISKSGKLELVAPISMQIICFRYVAKNKSNEQLNAINNEILLQLQEKGIAVPSSTILNGKFVLRVSITNHRTKISDLELFINEVSKLGDEFSKKF